MKHTFLKFCAAIIAFAGLNVFSPDAYAQENTPVGGGGTVSGTVTDSQGGSGGKPCVLRIDFLQSKKKVFHVRYASQLGSEVFYFGIERFGRGIG